MAFFLQLFLLVALGANAAVHRERHQAATLSFEVQSSGALVRRHQDEDQDSNATEEANGTDDLEGEVAKADELRKQMKTPERTVDPDADDDNWHWDELGNHSNASKRKMDGPVDPVDGNRTLESNTSNVSGLECLQTDQFYLEGDVLENSTEAEPGGCQKRCQSVAACAHWSYAPANGACFLQNASARKAMVKGMISGPPSCEDPLKQPQTPAAKVTTVKPPTWGVQSGGQSCYHLSASYSPLDMPSAGRTREVNYEQCQFRCFKTKNCAHFTYFMEDKGCHLQNCASTMVYLPGSIAGDAMCTEEEKAKFEEHMRSLPRMGKHDAIPCEDSWSSFVPFDLPTDDLQQPGDGPAADAVTCQGMKEQRRGAAGCKHSAQVRKNCPLLCGVCGSSGDACADGKKDEHPLFLVGNETLNCTSLQDACHHDDEVDLKCKETCGFCTTPAARDRPKGPSLESLKKIGCNRRRSMGYCFTRRRRLF